MDNKGISRRGFLTGAAAISAALAGAGLTGCAPKVVGVAGGAGSGTGSANGQTVGYDGTGVMPWLGEAPSISDSDVAETLEADVVVVGLALRVSPPRVPLPKRARKSSPSRHLPRSTAWPATWPSWVAKPWRSGAAATASLTSTWW